MRQGSGLTSSMHLERTEPHFLSVRSIPSVPLGVLMIPAVLEGRGYFSDAQLGKLRLEGATSLTAI